MLSSLLLILLSEYKASPEVNTPIFLDLILSSFVINLKSSFFKSSPE